MKFVTFKNLQNQERLGFVVGENTYDLQKTAQKYDIQLPSTILELIYGDEELLEKARKVENNVKESQDAEKESHFTLLAPIPRPVSCRDAYAFRQHVASARRNRGVDMIPEFDQFPIFYFTNHNAVFGEGDVIVEKDHLEKLDFELEWAAVIGKGGRNISSKDADNHIFGYTIMNDLSARRLQMEEMKLNLGPAKGKDFATTIGPWLVTPDELEDKKITTEFGNQYDLEMKAFHNGEQISYGNTKDMTYTFAEIIERVSYGIEVYPGEVIGSGTVGTGCYLELNGTRRREADESGNDYDPVWLENNDTIDLEVTGLGKLTNKIVLSNSDESILAKKKNV